MINEKILERCKKLLALSASDNAHEAELAQRKLGELMAEHDIESSHLEDNNSEADIGQAAIAPNGQRVTSWFINFVSNIVRAMGGDCLVYRGRGRGKDSILMFAQSHSLQLIHGITTFALETMEKHYLRDYRDAQKHGDYKPSKPPYALAFGYAYAKRLFDAYNEKVESTEGGALIVSDQREKLASHIDKMSGGPPIKTSVKQDRMSAAMGYRAGNEASIGKQIA